MARLITAVERMNRARVLVQKARDLAPPTNTGLSDFSYVAQVKDYLRQARDLIKFIRLSPSATLDTKDEVAKIFREIEDTETELLRK